MGVMIMNREDFPMLNQDIVYFDNGATTLKPKCVIDKTVEYYSKYGANAHRGDYDISFKVDQEYENTRNLVKNFINAKHLEEVVFTSGATESLNLIARGFFANILEPGDEVLITTSEHASNVLPWFYLAKTNGIKINYITLDDNHYVTLENLKKSITPKTKVISLAYITNVIGDIRPIKEITEFAHQNNIFVVVDAAQSIGHVKTDVQVLDVDFLAFSAHKMCGPTGVGVLYGKKELLENLTPLLLGGGMNESFDNENAVYLKDLPTRLEAGTPNIAGVIAFGEAIKYITNIGIDRINEYEKKLRKYLIDKLIDIPYLDIINIESDSGIVSFNVSDIFSQDVAYYLNKYNICVRAGNHCAKILKKEVGVNNTIRVSLYFYNTYEEVDELVELLSNKDKILKEML
jgi:cysteine desulfurase/selenocysteine lyase